MRKERHFMIFLSIFLTGLSLIGCTTETKKITIFYDSNGGTTIESDMINIGQPFTLPDDPSKTGYIFLGWYTDNNVFTKEFTISFDLSKVETNELSVYAKWSLIESTWTISFEENGGSAVVDINEISGTNINEPTEPTKEGFEFAGWYSDVTLVTPYVFHVMPSSNLTLYAKWTPRNITISFDENGGSLLEDIIQAYGSVVSTPNPPTKDGFTFIGWFIDAELTTLYEFTTMPASHVNLYAKWEPNSIDNHLMTDTLPLYSTYYGNTNGNLNNLGLVVYDTKRALHYYAYGSTIYQYSPSTEVISVLTIVGLSGRATFLNVKGDILYFIDSNTNHLMAYDLINKTLSTISDTQNIYASVTQTWVNYLYTTILYDEPVVAFTRYITSNQTYSSMQGTGYEHMCIDGTRVYYKPINAISLNVMSYNGSGKSTIIDLTTLNVTEQHESLLLKVNQNYVASFALILTIGQETGLYLYNSVDGLVKVMASSGSLMHSLNYDGIYLYVIQNDGIYRIDPISLVYEKIQTVSSDAAYLNIVNHWLYVGSHSTHHIFRINPSTNEIETLLINS